MRIRVAREGDWEDCLALDLSYTTEIAWQMEERRGDKEWSVRFVKVRLPRQQRIEPNLSPDILSKVWPHRDNFWVAVEKRLILGYLGVILDPERQQARIVDLGVMPEVRRRGVATALLQHATTWCLRQHINGLILVTLPKAQPVIGFALSQGFTFCGFQDAYWPGQDVGLFFRKRIP
ncbi:MAG: GNAT family N-acetyltransferase [Anaerolineae bacterium]|nr:GNAT family N-acetyltransferase [Anaerolineae bacterium]